MILHSNEVRQATMGTQKKAPKKAAPKKAAKQAEKGEGRSELREALFALFDSKGPEATDEQVQAIAKKHGKDLSHNNCVKYRSVWRKARGVAAERKAPAAKPKATFKKAERKPKAEKAAAPKKAAKAKAPKPAKAAKAPKKARANGPVAEASEGSSAVDALLGALDG